MKRTLLTIIAIALLSTGISAQRNLREAAELGLPNRHIDVQTRAIGPDTLQGLIRQADLVVRGEMLSANSHFISNDTWIVTDYKVYERERYYARGAALKPEPILFTRGGGWVQVTEDRTAAVTIDAITRFDTGDQQYIFFFVRGRDGHYGLVGGPRAMLVIDNGKVYWQGKRVPVKDFIDELKAAIKEVERQGRGTKE